jgi:RNA polymerase sigma factor (sigma-70 family)
MFEQVPKMSCPIPLDWSALWDLAYQRYFRLWFNLAKSVDISDDEAKDLVHSVIASILAEPSRPISSLEHARNYVAKGVLNRAKGLRMRQGKRTGWVQEIECRFAVHQDEMNRDESLRRERLRRAVNHLSRKDFNILKFRFYSGFTLAESAQILGMPISTIASREAVILRQLRKRLRRYGF